jgi:GTP pyrophosphokinase
MRKLVPRVATDKEGVLSRIIQRVGRDKSIRVGGLDNLALSIGDCCNPLPGDQIIGFQLAGKGVVIHRTDCRRIGALLDDERKVISVAWDVERDDRFIARVQIIADDRPNLLLDVTQILALHKVNIVRLSLHIEDKLAIGSMTMEVRNLPHLTRVISKIHSLRGVLKAERLDDETEEAIID